MGLLRNAAKLGLAKKLFDEARKPENQRKVKQLIASVRSSRQQPPRR